MSAHCDIFSGHTDTEKDLGKTGKGNQGKKAQHQTVVVSKLSSDVKRGSSQETITLQTNKKGKKKHATASESQNSKATAADKLSTNATSRDNLDSNALGVLNDEASLRYVKVKRSTSSGKQTIKVSQRTNIFAS